MTAAASRLGWMLFPLSPSPPSLCVVEQHARGRLALPVRGHSLHVEKAKASTLRNVVAEFCQKRKTRAVRTRRKREWSAASDVRDLLSATARRAGRAHKMEPSSTHLDAPTNARIPPLHTNAINPNQLCSAQALAEFIFPVPVPVPVPRVLTYGLGAVHHEGGERLLDSLDHFDLLSVDELAP